MNFLDLFSGIGGFRLGMEQAGHTCMGYVEFDKYARKSYEAMHNTSEEWTAWDITSVKDDEWRDISEDVDIIVGGSPCQSFSVAGKGHGFEDTRGTLFFEYARAIKHTKPNYFLYENVKGLVDHDKGKTIRIMLETFDELGYAVDFDIFNSKFYGVPQNRERIYIMGKRKELVELDYTYDIKEKLVIDKLKEWANENVALADLLPENGNLTVDTRLKDILEETVDEKFYLSEEKTRSLTKQLKTTNTVVLDPSQQKREGKLRVYEELSPTITARDYKEPRMVGMLDTKGHEATRRVYDSKGISPTVTTMGGGNREPKVVEYDRKDGVGKELDVSLSLNSSDWRGLNRNQKQNAVLSIGNVNPSGNGMNGEGNKTSEPRAVLTPERLEKDKTEDALKTRRTNVYANGAR